MSTLFTLLFLFCLCAVAVGVFSPTIVIHWKKEPLRVDVIKLYGSGIIISFIMFSIFSSPNVNKNEKKEKITVAKSIINKNTQIKLIDVELNYTTEFKSGKFYISGSTNLPNGTSLMISLDKENGFGASSKISVKNNQFISGGFSNKGTPLTNGIYKLNISTPLACIQPTNVQKVIGERAKNLYGNLVVKGDRIFKNENFVKLVALIEVSNSIEPVNDSTELLTYLRKFESLYSSLYNERKKGNFLPVWSRNWNIELNELKKKFDAKFGSNSNEYKGECFGGFYNIGVGAGYLHNVWSEQNALFSGRGKTKILNDMENYTNAHFALAKEELTKCK